jgi:uncharacterized protein YlzI (FlbEa/FlbD family)
MKQFIQLTRPDGKKIYVNQDHVVDMDREGESTSLWLEDEQRIRVTETPEKINEILWYIEKEGVFQ